jgi:glycosyltransferase 2 family protein
MRKVLPNLVKITVSFVLIAVLFLYLVDVQKVLEEIHSAKWGFLIVAAILMIGGTALRAVRWRALLNGLAIHVPMSQLIYFYFAGSFFNLFLPSGMGGDAVKMAMLARHTGRVPEAIGTTLVDRAVGLWVLFALALAALPFSYALLPAATISAIAAISVVGVVGGAVIMGTALLPWLGSKVRLPKQQKLERFYHSVSGLGYAALGRACLVSLVFNILLIAFIMLIALSMDVHLPVGVYMLFTPILSLALTMPISISGLGTREAAYIVLFGALGVSRELAVAMSLINYFLNNVLVGLMGGLLYALSGSKSKRETPKISA